MRGYLGGSARGGRAKSSGKGKRANGSDKGRRRRREPVEEIVDDDFDDADDGKVVLSENAMNLSDLKQRPAAELVDDRLHSAMPAGRALASHAKPAAG